MSVAFEFSTSQDGMMTSAAAAFIPRGGRRGRFDQEDDDDDENNSSSSSSSIGKNSDDEDEDEVEQQQQQQSSSSSSSSPLTCFDDALQQLLPIKRGISTYYTGKSKSFTSLADAESCSSIKDISKPEDAYCRKRKNLLAHNLFWDKNRNLTSNSNNGGISKRPASTSKSTLVLGLAMDGKISSSNSNSSSTHVSLPPLPRQSQKSGVHYSELSDSPRRSFSPWRSFSLCDLQHASAANSSCAVPLINDNKVGGEGLH